MKSILTLIVAGGLTLSAWGQQTVTTNLSVNLVVPDGDANGLVSSVGLAGYAAPIDNVTVSLNLSGGYNGDLYAYLLGPAGQFAVLLNRVGLSAGNANGYGNTGFDFTLDAAAPNNVHNYQGFSPIYNGNGQLTGTWAPDARNIDPQSSGTVFDSTPANPAASLSSFAGTDANGTWALFIADLSGGGQSTLVSWGLTAVTVPEPQAWLMLSGGLAVLGLLRGRRNLWGR
jgi:subtilisin-like proprotein convertase family protein